MHRFFFIAGEPSGDRHAAQVARRIFAHNELTQIMGWGGDDMKDAGVSIHTHITELSVMGFTDVIKKIPKLISLFNRCKAQISAYKPDAILFIDYSGFNLRMAKWAKKKGYATHFYIAPKTWAWRPRRNTTINKCIDHLYCILPHEESYFKSHGINAHYVGNPLTELSHPASKNTQNTVALLPGSRHQELAKILPIFKTLTKQNPQYYWLLSTVSSIPIEVYRDLLGEDVMNKLTIINDDATAALSRANAAVITSGTATLEAAIIGCPQVVVYSTSWINYWIGKLWIKVKYISLPNIIVDKKIIPELIQKEYSAGNIEKQLSQLSSEKMRAQIKEDYNEVKRLLGDKNAADNVALSILNSVK